LWHILGNTEDHFPQQNDVQGRDFAIVIGICGDHFVGGVGRTVSVWAKSGADNPSKSRKVNVFFIG